VLFCEFFVTSWAFNRLERKRPIWTQLHHSSDRLIGP
jgi:hypothetical protein